jgi:hypothetical protein
MSEENEETTDKTPEPEKFAVVAQLESNSAIHCATLAIAQNVVEDGKWPQLARPDAALRNGTLTFVQTGGRTYCITCNHVIQHYRAVLKASGNEYSHALRTMVNGFFSVADNFFQPSAQFGEGPLDVAISEINPKHISHIGKTPIDLDKPTAPPSDIKFAIAVGFPEKLKYNKPEEDSNGHYRVSMPHVTVVAGLSHLPHRRFALFSEVKVPDYDYSGLSGGPIFWSTDTDYGILGIIYEGGAGSDLNSIYVYGEFATPEIIKRWISEIASERTA